MDVLNRSAQQRWITYVRSDAGGYVVTVLGVAVLTAGLIPLRHRLGLVSIGLLFLLLVVLISFRWGWGPGLCASLIANLAFNYFFVPPRLRFTVQEPSNILALIVFLVVAALTSTLVGRARISEAAARRREQETAILYDLSRLIIGDVDLGSALAAVCERVRQTFAAESAAVLLPRDGDLAPAVWVGRSDDGPRTVDEHHAAVQASSTGRTVMLGAGPGRRMPRIVGVTGRPAPVVYVPLRVGGHTSGVLRVVGRLRARVFSDDERRLLEAFADEAAPAVERDRLLKEAARLQAVQEADRLKSALLSAVSHDLRTPLASIKASVSSLLQSDIPWDAETRREFLIAIDEETDRLTRLVSNLLDLSRIEGSALQPEQDWYNVREFLETTVARLGRTVTHHRLTLDLAPDTGDALFDYVQIGQVVTNLIENAAKFAPAETEIRIAAHRVAAWIEISVEDEGPGIPAAEREHVFDKFYRIVRAGLGAPGTGLGLAICRGLVEAHGGQIHVEASPRGGARFVFTLPAPAAPSSPLATAAGAGVEAAR
jgi:two-component system sensor histidine kinase KdpD